MFVYRLLRRFSRRLWLAIARGRVTSARRAVREATRHLGSRFRLYRRNRDLRMTDDVSGDADPLGMTRRCVARLQILICVSANPEAEVSIRTSPEERATLIFRPGTVAVVNAAFRRTAFGLATWAVADVFGCDNSIPFDLAYESHAVFSACASVMRDGAVNFCVHILASLTDDSYYRFLHLHEAILHYVIDERGEDDEPDAGVPADDVRLSRVRAIVLDVGYSYRVRLSRVRTVAQVLQTGLRKLVMPAPVPRGPRLRVGHLREILGSHYPLCFENYPADVDIASGGARFDVHLIYGRLGGP
ncbi:ORF030 [Saltwater crocodilepox virus]|nr:hypothetical protein [Saltwater crocodilepox virus]AVD69367.1 hypothetical protein [Saltwater crocodilepox virus]QGT46469.1 ORF030 [Saltwater crocodilepox virus]QGT46685.1 ORF030 [Saltwater crocodilepox virus]QGT46902.1 ORF030 [Saltwater crocodilepox virus]